MTFYKFFKILATTLLLGQGLYRSTVSPGIADLYGGIVAGISMYAIWFAQEKVK